MKFRHLPFLSLFLVALSASVWPAAAQFTITAPVKSSEAINPADTIPLRKPSYLSNDFFNRAYWQAEQRRIRKERNTIEFISTFQASQTQFENWASGGDNTFSGRSTLYFRHQYRKNKFSLDYKAEARYGVSYIEGKSFKNEDEFTIYGLTGRNFTEFWSYSGSVNLRSQFATGYKSRDDRTRISTLMAPGFLELALGFTYSRSPFTIVLSPVGGNAVFVLDDELSAQGINGVEPGKRSKWQVGPSVRIDFDKAWVNDIIRYRSNFYTFTNIKNPPSVRWENSLDISPTKFLTATLYALAYYDKDSETPKKTAVQFKYSFSIGLAYTFANKKTD